MEEIEGMEVMEEIDMNEIEKYKQKEKDYIEAEIVDDFNDRFKERKSPKRGFLNEVLFKFKKAVFLFLLSVSLILIVIGSILSFTVIGAIIGLPLIIIGFILILFSFRIFFKNINF